MNTLDLLILLPIAFFAYRGFKNGLIREVLGIAGIVFGVFLAFRYMDEAGAYLQPLFGEQVEYVPFVAAFLIFVGTLVAVNILALMIKKLLDAIQLNFINRATGLVFGALKCGIVISALLLMAAGFNIPSQEMRSESSSYPYILTLAPWAYDRVASVYPGAEDFAKTARKTFNEHHPFNHIPSHE